MTRYFLFGLFSLLVLIAGAQPTGRRYQLQKLAAVNSFYHDAAPVIAPDGNTLYFFVQNHPENTYGKESSQDIWKSTKDPKGIWSAPVHLSSPFNQSRQNQVFQVLHDGSVLIRGGRNKNEPGFSIVGAGGGFQALRIPDFETMSRGRFSGATISSDGKHLIMYFSEVAGSIKSDLYVSHLGPDGLWTKPVKLKLSTGADEFGPFISPDQKTLFFASDRIVPGRQGSVDMYKTVRLDDTWNNFGEVTNLGKPINTTAEDDYFSMDDAGNVYTARSLSRQDGGNLDIFVMVPKNINVTLEGQILNSKSGQPLQGEVEIIIPDHPSLKLKSDGSGNFKSNIAESPSMTIRSFVQGFKAFEQTIFIPHMSADSTIRAEVRLEPEKTPMVIAGKVFDAKTKMPLVADVRVRSKSGFSSVVRSDGGSYKMEVDQAARYYFTLGLSGYLSLYDSVDYKEERVALIEKNLAVRPIEVGAVVRLKNIYFDYDRTTLKKESSVELGKVVSFLKENPSVRIEIQGHTDSQGSDQYNLTLSQGRSQSVVDYLVGQGVDRNRLAAKGFGETKPIESNDTEVGRAANRRVEFTVTGL
ncbi:MAG: OmpA family protein [Bacteroidetes bacterium]|nr:OmpA family protein [Bacteroidota bacterium]